MPTVAILAVQNSMFSSITGPLDIFSVASLEWQRMFPSEDTPLFKATVVGPASRHITAFSGSLIPIEAFFNRATIYEIVFIPVIFGDLEKILNDGETIDWLRWQGTQGACLCSVCAGSFLLAQAGMLDGRKATTHWNLADNFAARFPGVIVKKEKMLVDEGDRITAGGVTAYLDLSLHLTGRFGSRELAAVLSKILLIDPSRCLQSPYMTCSFNRTHGDKAIHAIQDWLHDNYQHDIMVSDLSLRAGLGERTFMRKFKKATGDTPIEYLQQLRIEAARMLLEGTTETVEVITLKTGYGDTSSFRKLFKKYTGLSPSQYRKRFSHLL